MSEKIGFLENHIIRNQVEEKTIISSIVWNANTLIFPYPLTLIWIVVILEHIPLR